MTSHIILQPIDPAIADQPARITAAAARALWFASLVLNKRSSIGNTGRESAVRVFLLRRRCRYVGWGKRLIAACAVVRCDCQKNRRTQHEVDERQFGHLIPHA